MEIFFEPTCIVCGDPIAFNEVLCRKCIKKIYAPSITDGAYKIYHYGKYEYPLSKIITEFKYHSHPKIANTLGELLLKWFLSLNFPELPYSVSYVPSNYLSKYEKGFTPAKLIAESFSQLLGFPLIQLFESKTFRRQAQLNVKERTKNIKNKIKLTGTPTPYLIIIDDVYTTGSTMNEIENLVKNECEILICLTVARTIHR